MASAVLSLNQVNYLKLRTRRNFSVSLIAASLLHTVVFAAYFKAEFLPPGAEQLQLESQVIKMSFVQKMAQPVIKQINDHPEISKKKQELKPEPIKETVVAKVSPVTQPPEPVQTYSEDIIQKKNDIAVMNKPEHIEVVADNYQPPSSNISYHQNPDPYYPRAAIRRGMEGTVELAVYVDSTGSPVNIEIRQSSGYNILDREAVIAVWKWKFKPAYRGTVAVPGDAIVPIHYRLEQG